ncbi:hypothetical protein NEOLEDRAFT_1072671 [Neolentinus lepideus HHB14362 ss-1]|uniref:UbiA prenyltransferase n=1 Tax=Neolentinus lepideus HHB14362 ss-1 TaxID=1314782 RepID=A0A165Q4Q9_9AGAM|nr:hypothetical protein NEOLEDRAFT_1072671 [Neolentinus lepideus HHB14362 ss-1]
MSSFAHHSSSISYFLYTCLLFTKSDIKTTVIPVSSLASAAAPLNGPIRLLQVIFWVWFHVLQFDVSNQTLDPDEDEKNKGDRPLPAKRMTLNTAIRFRWILVPACWVLSWLYSVQTLYASIALVILTIVYNEFEAHRRHWVIRNIVNALGFCSFEAGATLIAGSDTSKLDIVAVWSILASTGIFATTIHTQDFKDVDGDRAIGRQTIPIVYGKHARWTVIGPLLLWSAGLSVFWGLDVAASAAFVLLAMFVGVQYIIGKTVKDYQLAFYWYNVWLTIAHALPAYYRLNSAMVSGY